MSGQTNSVEGRSQSGVLALMITIAAAGVHAWAGWSEGGRVSFHIVGHQSLFAAAAWAIALGAAAISLVISRGRAVPAVVALLVALVGLAGLLTA
jgi:hypothetical protein